MKRFFSLTVLIFLFSSASIFAQDTIKIMAWNLLGYKAAPSSRDQYFRKVIKAVNPDIIVVNEIDGQSTVTGFLNNCANYYTPGLYTATTYINGFDTDNALYFKSTKLQFILNYAISTPQGRDINLFVMKDIVQNVTFNVLGCHLKAGSTATDYTRRAGEVTALRTFTNSQAPGTYNIIVGDFNMYASTDSAYKVLTAVTPGNTGHFIDPDPLTGTWNNFNYRAHHTQSTRTRQLSDSGSTGGMDDKFDLVLFSKGIADGTGSVTYIPNSYKGYGNDGNHYNDSINKRPNTAVPDSIADALYYASDHLPSVSQFRIYAGVSVSQISSIVPDKIELKQNYPNPFNPETKIKFDIPQNGYVRLSVYNSLGQKITDLVSQNLSAGEYESDWNAKDFASGIYIYRLETENFTQTKQMLLIK
ncbi:MAG: T9SS type A sorting domain-containing protein [Bacteroidetes bacterium]|nr:T9SS type A sorting domain-containing protein [Bacteroidota bacterium]